jgi:hypothetical protein
MGRIKWKGKTEKIPFMREKIVVMTATIIAATTMNNRSTSIFSTDIYDTYGSLPNFPRYRYHGSV